MRRKPLKLRNLKPRTPDAAVIAQIKKLKPNLSKPCPIRFFLYFSAEEGALRSAIELRKQGFIVEVVPSQRKYQWLCLALKELMPDVTALTTFRGKMVELAQKYQGEYDGWEAEIANESSDGS